jgi:hypothetical protein
VAWHKAGPGSCLGADRLAEALTDSAAQERVRRFVRDTWEEGTRGAAAAPVSAAARNGSGAVGR